MPNSEQDPAGSTHEFRAFAARGESGQGSGNTGLIIGATVAVLVIAVVVALLVI